MEKRSRASAACLLAVLCLCGCGGSPTLTAPTHPPATASAGLVGALSIPVFEVTGWYADGRFHYVPRLTLAASANGGLSVQEVVFKVRDTDLASISGVRYGPPLPSIPAGGTLPLMHDAGHDSTPDLASSIALATLTAVVTVTDEASRRETVSAVARVPDVPQGAPAANLVLESFTVDGSTRDEWFNYRPKLTLSEVAGTSSAWLRKVTFELLDAGPDGRVPPIWDVGRVPAGGTLKLNTVTYGEPWIELESQKVNASRVSVHIDFIDDLGHAGSLDGVAVVSR